MALNDFVLIDGIIDQIITDNGLDISNNSTRGTVFEKFAISELLKTYDLSLEQIENGIVDGGDDGGLDGFYIFVNGIYISDSQNFYWPRENAKLEIYLITCKHHNTYELNPMESLDSSLSELLNFSISTTELNRKYNEKILKKRELLYTAYRHLAAQNINPIVNIFYISRGDSSQVPNDIRCTGEKLITTCHNVFENAQPTMNFWGTKEIINQYRKKRNIPIEIKVQRYLQLGNNYVILVNLNDYIRAIIDDDNKLKRYLFDENVRDYLGENTINSAIMETLIDKQSPDFWLLNNGITVLTSHANIFDNIITINDLQIVNGLQTSFTLFNYFEKGNDDADRKILIKVIKSTNKDISKKITKATNSQSAIPLYALHANDDIQKDIEDILLKSNFYYERRPMYYSNLGYPKERIIAPLNLAGGFVALILKLPHRAISLKSKFMDNPKLSNKVFSDSIDINVWPIIASVITKTDLVTQQYRKIVKKSTEKYLKCVRYIVALVSLARIFGKFSFGINDLLKLNFDDYSEAIIRGTVENLIDYINRSDLNSISKIKKRENINLYLKHAGDHFEICDFVSIEKRKDLIIDDHIFKLTEDFINNVQQSLPEQPWPKDIHKTIASTMNCPNAKVWQAIDLLMERGLVKRQKNGVILE